MHIKIDIRPLLFWFLLYTLPLDVIALTHFPICIPFAEENLIDTSKAPITAPYKYGSFACNFTPSLWLKADAGISLSGGNVSNWADQSGNTNNAFQNSNNIRPLYRSESINFNPALDFDGSNDYLQGNGGFSNSTLFMVARSDLAVTRNTSGQTIITANIVNPVSDAYFFSIGSVTAAFNNEVITHAVGHSLEYRKALTGNSTILSVPHLYNIDHNPTSSNSAVYYDGTKIDNNNSGNFINPETNRPYRVGGNLYVWGGTYFNGQIAEILSFPTNLIQNDRELIQSYLAIKYGLTLPHAYKDVDENIVWNEAGYANNIAGIGRDDCLGLYQKQSKSSQSGAILSIGLGSIANSNASNNNTFSINQSFLFWGHDNDNNGTIEEINSDLPAGVQNRLDREWKIRNTNTVGSLEIQFDLSGIVNSTNSVKDLYLLIDEDGDGNFTTGNIQKIAATSFNSNIVGFSNVTLTDGVIISLATLLNPNNAPQLTCPNTSFKVCPNGQKYEIAPNITVADLDNDDVTAEIIISGITNNLDVLAVDLTGFPSANQSFNYPVLQITGTINPAQLQAILQTLHFSTNSTTAGIRNVSILINDTLDKSNEIIKAIQADENLSACCSANAPLISN